MSARLAIEVLANKGRSSSSCVSSTGAVACTEASFTIPCSIAPDVLSVPLLPVSDGYPTQISIFNSVVETTGTIMECIGPIVSIANYLATHKVVRDRISVVYYRVTLFSISVCRTAHSLS